MSIIILLVVASLFVAGGFLFAFMWAVRNGQFDDPVSPAARILIEDDPIPQDSKHILRKGEPSS